VFTTVERENFAKYGLIKRENFLPSGKFARVREVILERLEEEGIWLDGRWHLPDGIESTELNAGMPLVKPLNRHEMIIDLVRGEVADAASALVDGRAVYPMSPHPALLFTLPNATTWTIPHKNWHLDLPRLADGGAPGVQFFALLERVEAGGGGTLVVAGSHRLLNDEGRISSADLRKRLKREPYFEELMSNKGEDRLRLLREIGRVGDVELQVVEMTGEAGDVYFMDLRMLHTVAPNALRIPRLMITQRFLLKSSHMALGEK
jgi:hypothetical protein